MERLQRACPECFERMVVSDTVVIPPAKADTMVPLRTLEEGVVLHLDQTILTLAIEGDTILVHAERPPDTVVVTVPVKVPQPVPDKSKDLPVGVIIFLAFLVFLTFINIKLTKKQSK